MIFSAMHALDESKRFLVRANTIQEAHTKALIRFAGISYNTIPMPQDKIFLIGLFRNQGRFIE